MTASIHIMIAIYCTTAWTLSFVTTRSSHSTTHTPVLKLQSQTPRSLKRSTSLSKAKMSLSPRLVGRIVDRERIASIAFSPDGRSFVTGTGHASGDVDDHGSLRLWHSASGRLLRNIRLRSNQAGAVAAGPNGQTLASISTTAVGEDDTPNDVNLWDVASGELAHSVATTSASEGILAFSPDGKTLVRGGKDGSIDLWNASNGARMGRAMKIKGGVESIAFHHDSHVIACGSGDGQIVLLDVRKRSIQLRYRAHRGTVSALAFGANGRLLASGGTDHYIRVWDTTHYRNAGRAIDVSHFVPKTDRVRFLSFENDGMTLACGVASDGRESMLHVLRLNIERGKLLSVLAFPDLHSPIALSSNGSTLAGCNVEGNEFLLWDLHNGTKRVLSPGYPSVPTSSAVFSRDGQFMESFINEFSDNTGTLEWDLEAGKPTVIGRAPHRPSRWDDIGVSDDNPFIRKQEDGSLQIVDPQSGVIAGRITAKEHIVAARFSPDMKSLASGNDQGLIRLWNVRDGTQGSFVGIHRGGTSIKRLAFSADGVIIASYNGRSIMAWDPPNVKVVREIPGPPDFEDYTNIEVSNSGESYAIFSIGPYSRLRIWSRGLRKWLAPSILPELTDLAFSPDGTTLATVHNQPPYLLLTDVETGKRLFTPKLSETHTGATTSVSFHPSGEYVASASADGSIRLWRMVGKSARLFCTMCVFSDRSWAVISPDGRFDCSSIEAMRSLHWVLPDSLDEPLPLESFMRIYYEPRLLPRLLSKNAGELLKPIHPIADLNRAQPRVRIAKIEPESGSPDTVAVTVELSGGVYRFQQGGKEVIHRTGVYDLRLFRDSQLVDEAPNDEKAFRTEPKPGDLSEASLKAWQQAHELKPEMLAPIRKPTFTFHHIRLPHGAGLKSVEFSAYAFNSDRVKSETDRKNFDLPASIQARGGRAYLISVGVGDNQVKDLRLPLPAGDASMLQHALSEKLAGTGHYQEIVSIPLISDPDNARSSTYILPTRENLHTVLDLLAGYAVMPERLQAIPPALRDKLQPSTPDDLVLIFFSGHGEKDTQGTFYLFPYDTAPTSGTEISGGLLQHCISSDQLAFWLRHVDAGQMVMILDACHSAAAPGAEFKPAPLGDRGLGQLSYDKQMRILAATQADNVAKGPAVLGSGLLTYALVKEGLEEGKALKDSKLLLKDWLEYGVERVPELYKEYYPEQAKNSPNAVQQPMLFDFARKLPDLALTQSK